MYSTPAAIEAPLHISVTELSRQHTTREDGRMALANLLTRVQIQDKLTLDFSNLVLTPSFAETLLGGLTAELGLSEFKRRISLQGVEEAARPLVRMVVLKHAIAKAN